MAHADHGEPPRWLLLIHQIPPQPAYFRAKVGKRLQRLGAVPIKNSVYVLPFTGQTQEDFQWVVREIVTDGGECRQATAGLPSQLARDDERRTELEATLGRLHKRMAEIAAVDFFGAPG